MQDNETEPTPTDEIQDGSESAALEQQTTDPSGSDQIANDFDPDTRLRAT